MRRGAGVKLREGTGQGKRKNGARVFVRGQKHGWRLARKKGSRSYRLLMKKMNKVVLRPMLSAEILRAVLSSDATDNKTLEWERHAAGRRNRGGCLVITDREKNKGKRVGRRRALEFAQEKRRTG